MSDSNGRVVDFDEELKRIIDVSRTLLEVDDDTAASRPSPSRWSPKEILGHLIDSAVNNHHRFVRLQHDPVLEFPAYQQNEWVRIQNYQERDWKELVILWATYNRHLLWILRHLDPACLDRCWNAPGQTWKASQGATDLRFLIRDYFDHMRHHLLQISAATVRRMEADDSR